MRGKLVVLILAVLTISPAAVLGDVFENFDQYANTTLSPWSPGNPWTLSYSSPGYSECFSGASGVTYIGGAPVSGSYTPPNVYTLGVTNNATCFAAAHYIQLSAGLNVTATGIIMKLIRRASSSATTAVNATIFLCGTRVFTALFSTEPTTYTNLTQSSLGAVGTTCNIQIRLYTQAGGSPVAANWRFDNVNVKNANLINSNANLFLADDIQTAGLGIASKPIWFNITDFRNSYAELDIPNQQPLTYSNLTAPDIHVKFNLGPTLLKVWVVPASYYVQIIPNDTTSNTVWLFNPAIVDTFTISIQDLSNKFGPGTTVQISQGSRVLSSGYTDSQNAYPIWIVPGSYSMLLTNGPNTYSTTVNFPSVNGASVPVQILKYTQGGNCGQICTISYNAGFDASQTNIVITYSDTTGTTTSVNDQIWVNGPLGASQFYTHTWTPGPFGTLTDIVSCAVDACNSTLASSIYVVLVFTNSYGQNTENIPVSGGNIFSSIPNIPGSILAWNVVFPTSPSPLNFAAYIVVLMSAAGMGAQAAKFGAIVIPAEVAVFAAAGWLPLVDGASLVLIGLGVVGFIAFLEHGR